MELFADEHSITRRIWGNSDTVLFIFAGAAAEFALNKAVDWLYFTGKLPADPIGRLFSTVTYAHQIIFAPKEAAYAAIHKIAAIHAGIENARQSAIPDWAYRDVLYMLIYYSVAAYELLERKLTHHEKEEVYHIFYKVGSGMGLKSLPPNYTVWLPDRQAHLQADLAKSRYTTDLFNQYKKHLGTFRYGLLLQAQAALVPPQVKKLLHIKPAVWFSPLLKVYGKIKAYRLGRLLKAVLLPAAYRAQIAALDIS